MKSLCQCEGPPVGHEFTSDQWAQIDTVLARFREKPGALIPVLEEIQEVVGYLPESIQRHVAKGLGIPLSKVYGVVTFYSFFTMKPRGKHQIRVCLGTACHVRGSKRIIDAVEKELNISLGECTEDRQFSLDAVRCLGACGLAPAMVVNDHTHKQVKVARIKRILDEYRNASTDKEG